MDNQATRGIEAIISNFRIGELIEILEHVCQLKAEYLRTSRQTKETVKAWEKQGRHFAKVRVFV
jgi:hypothetical protein